MTIQVKNKSGQKTNGVYVNNIEFHWTEETSDCPDDNDMQNE